VLATAALLVMFFVFPVYTTGGDSYSSETGVTTHSNGSATLFASNPQAFTVLRGIVALALVALVLALITAWRGSPQARKALAVVLIPLSFLAILGVFSVGVFMAPLLGLGWWVFALCATSPGRETGS
jgi:hypothetical protein